MFFSFDYVIKEMVNELQKIRFGEDFWLFIFKTDLNLKNLGSWV